MKKKILNVILIIVVLIFIVVLIKFLYNFSIYKKLLNAVEKLYESNNYSCFYYSSGEKYDDETNSFIKIYSKMGIEVKGDKIVSSVFDTSNNDYKLIGKSYLDKSDISSSVFVNFEENSFEIQPNIISPEYRERLINYPIYNYKDYLANSTSLKSKFEYAFMNIITIINTKFYEVSEDEKNYLVMKIHDIETYINKDTLLVEKQKSNINNVQENIVLYEIEVGNVKDEDVEVPNLSNFRQNVW